MVHKKRESKRHSNRISTIIPSFVHFSYQPNCYTKIRLPTDHLQTYNSNHHLCRRCIRIFQHHPLAPRQTTFLLTNLRLPYIYPQIGQVSNKLKNRLEDMIVYGHQTPDETLLSVSEHGEGRRELPHTVNEEEAESNPDRPADAFIDESVLTPRLPRKSEHLIDEDTISRLTGIPEDGHSTPLGKTLPSSEESLATPISKTMSQYRRDEKIAAEKRDDDVQRIVYQIPSNMMQVREFCESLVPAQGDA